MSDEDPANPRNWTTDQLMTAIANAVKARDFRAVEALMLLLAVKDPHLAETVYEALKAVRAAFTIDYEGGRSAV